MLRVELRLKGRRGECSNITVLESMMLAFKIATISPGTKTVELGAESDSKATSNRKRLMIVSCKSKNFQI